MMSETEYRDKLLDMGRRVSFILFDTPEDKDIEAVLVESMELLGQCVDADQVYITQNETADGEEYFTCRSAWTGEAGRVKASINTGMRFPWGLDLDWDLRFRRGECLNGPVKKMSLPIQGFFAPFETQSALVIPVFVQEKFWGLVGFSDCKRERFFGEDEVDILRSMSLMMATAVNRKNMLADMRHRDYLLLTVNQAAEILLRSEPEDFIGTLRQCMGMMAHAMNAGCMYLWKNYTENGRLCCTQLHVWPENDRVSNLTNRIRDISYDDDTPVLKECYLRGESTNMLVRYMPPVEKALFTSLGILSVLTIPIFVKDRFWGFVGFDNCAEERLFTENEASIMRSGSLLVVNALLRNENILSIRDTSAKLEAALADAQEANNAKSDFLAHMSHEIRTPLNAVVGLSELVIDNGALDRDTEDKLEKIHDSGMTILSIVNDILDISKIESGKFEMTPIRYDTPSLINDTVTLNIVRIGEKIVTFKIYVDENLPGALYGDDLRVKQIFNNLLSNAFKYTHSGTVEWRVSFERDGGSVWLVSSVSDTGIGIKPEDMEKLFSDYNQVDMKRNRKVEGTGLGLAISKRLAETMGGSISAESEYGKGSTFRVRLRQDIASEAPIGKEVAKNLMDMRYTLARRDRNTKLIRINLSYAHVLIVDDIVTNLDVVKGMLKPYSMKVDCAVSGPQAIEMIQAENPRYNAVFMDHMMPGMDGIEATRIIREEIGTDYARNIPVIALTANAVVGNEEMFLNHGFQDFISKPIDIMKLDAALRQWVRNKKLEKELWGTGGNTPQPGAPEAGGSGSVLAGAVISGLDIAQALKRFSGDETALLDVLRSYAANTPRLLSDLRRHLEAGNLADYAIIVHGIKGASYSIFAPAAGEAAEALEMASRAGKLNTVTAQHPPFEKSAEALIASINTALAVLDAAKNKPAAAGPDPVLLKELRGACEAFDMDRIDNIMERLESFRYENDAAVAWLREQVDNMAFDTIAGGEWPV